jgi:hypothetical protein
MSMASEIAEALRWQKMLARYDGFVFVVAEYNTDPTGCQGERESVLTGELRPRQWA